jgi:membrane-bound lytic murein transglycosylase D
MFKRIALVLLAAFPFACSTSPQVKPVAAPSPVPRVSSQATLDAAEFRSELEKAYDRIVARSSGTAKGELVDADATLSMDIPDQRSIRGALSYFSNDLHDSIQTSLLRSARYKQLIDKSLDEYKLPRGLAYLPVIESAYVSTLTSRAGAHGMWQFMPSTARDYGLRVDWWIDERADPEKSTHAAARFLSDLYRQFGDWSLVLAAYNAGPGRIRRALDDTGAKSFWELQEQGAIPKETRGYVPTFFATLVIVSDPSRYGFKLADPYSVDVTPVDVTGPVSLDYIAEVAGIDSREIKELNPQFRRGIVPPEKVSVKVPKATAKTLLAHANNLRYEDPNVKIATFTMRRGDSIASLAKKLRLDADDIRGMNGGNDIRSGDSVYLPIAQSDLSIRLQQSAASSYHTVKKGDTLFSIAKNHGLSVEELLDLNRLESGHVIHPGDRLRVSLGAALTTGM